MLTGVCFISSGEQKQVDHGRSALIIQNRKVSRESHVKNIKKKIHYFREALKNNSNKERAEKEKAYLKSPYKFFGVSVPIIDKIAKEFKNSNKDIYPEYIFGLTKRLWGSECHEEKTLAIKILGYYPGYLNIDTLPMLEDMLEQSTGWDHVDGISIHLMGSILEKDKNAYKYLKKWSKSDNFWMRRASLISQILLFRDGRGDCKLFFEFAERMISEKEFFIRKAIGWTLREMSKTNPDEVFGFLMKVKDKASGLTLREGSKRLSERQRGLISKNYD